MIKWCLSAVVWLGASFMLARLGPIGRAPGLNAGFYLVGFAGMLLMLRFWPRQWSWRTSIVMISTLALAARCLFWPYPVGNDVYRYIWEGYIQLEGFNPYLFPPDSPELSRLILVHVKDVWAQINHKDLAAVYPPLALLYFSLLASVAPTTAVFKGGILVFDLILMVALVFMLRRRKLPVHGLLLYAANPLVLVYVAGEAHLDVIQAALLMLGIVFMRLDRLPLGFFLCGMAAMVKYLAVAVFPFVVTLKNRRAWPFALLALVCFIPFMDAGTMLFHSLLVFGGQMHYNDGLPVVIRLIFDAYAIPASLGLLMMLWVYIWLVVPDPLRSVYLACGTLLVLLPTLHPWYLLLMIPFTVLFPSRAWLYLCAAMVFTFPVMAVEYNSGVFQEIHVFKLWIYLPFAVLLWRDALRPDEEWSPTVYPPPDRVAVVIPTLNEADAVAAAVASVRQQSGVDEIVVADGGSTDRTTLAAQQAGARVVATAQGRGQQIQAGIAHTRADVIMVLHADTRLQREAVRRVREHLARHRRAPGGAFQMRFDGHGRYTRWIARLNHLRTRWTGISFGDQGQFFRRAALEAMGGYPRCMLMEDVELALRMKQIGRPLYLADGVVVSDRRWQKVGTGGNVVTVVGLCIRYLVQRRLGMALGDNRTFYQSYYRRHRE